MKLETIENEALRLPYSDQEKLIRILIRNLEASADDYWAKEALRRAKLIDEGKMELISGDVVRQKIKESLRQYRA